MLSYFFDLSYCYYFFIYLLYLLFIFIYLYSLYKYTYLYKYLSKYLYKKLLLFIGNFYDLLQVSENDMRNLLYCDFADPKSETRQYIPVRYRSSLRLLKSINAFLFKS